MSSSNRVDFSITEMQRVLMDEEMQVKSVSIEFARGIAVAIAAAARVLAERDAQSSLTLRSSGSATAGAPGLEPDDLR